MSKFLIVVDMQNDFIDGSLGTAEAVEIVPAVAERIRSAVAEGWTVVATQDTHGEDYLDTPEGRKLPVRHCIRGTVGWQLADAVKAALGGALVVEKPTFGSVRLPGILASASDAVEEIEVIGDDTVIVSRRPACRPPRTGRYGERR